MSFIPAILLQAFRSILSAVSCLNSFFRGTEEYRLPHTSGYTPQRTAVSVEVRKSTPPSTAAPKAPCMYGAGVPNGSMSTKSNFESRLNLEKRKVLASLLTNSHLFKEFALAFLLATLSAEGLKSTIVTSIRRESSFATLTPLAPIPARESQNVAPPPTASVIATEISLFTLAAGLKKKGVVGGSLLVRLVLGTRRVVFPSTILRSEFMCLEGF